MEEKREEVDEDEEGWEEDCEGGGGILPEFILKTFIKLTAFAEILFNMRKVFFACSNYIPTCTYQ